MTILHMLFGWRGRMRRRDYWIYSLASLAVFIAIYTPFFRPVRLTSALTALVRTGQISPMMLMAYVSLVLAMQYIQFCLHAKRWHDRNRPTIWAAILVGSNIFNIALSFVPRDTTGIVALALGLTNVLYLLMGLWALVECGFLDGDKGANRYGPSPKYPDPASDVF